ncbi:hypothetical protein ACH489_16070 [Streptomyces rubiginosohelvolus]|uniref:hypothetical protein n=1 Tax=Streptomyces rubiginosohelvolus TaxID=67362 RepID=UPI0037B5F73C
MSLQMVRFCAAVDSAAELRDRLPGVLAALDAASTTGLASTAYASESGTDFIPALELTDPRTNPLLTLPEAQRLRDAISRTAGGLITPTPEPFTIVGSYTS